MDVLCILNSGCCCLFSPLVLFLSLQFSSIKFLVTLFSGTVRPRRLKLVTHMNSGWMYHVYQNQTAAAYSFLCLFIFLSLQFSNIKNVSHFFVFHQLANIKNLHLQIVSIYLWWLWPGVCELCSLSAKFDLVNSILLGIITKYYPAVSFYSSGFLMYYYGI